MEDQTLLSPRHILKTHLKPQIWGLQIQGAPQCVTLMAECKLLVSNPLAMTLDLSGCGLKYDTLYANIGHCTQIGQDTFRSTSERMERVEWLAKEMSKPGGTIESMLEFIEPKQSALRDKRFKSHVMAGLNTIDESVRLISQVRQDFSSWKQVTTDLLRALEEKASSNKVQQRETRSKLENQTFEKKRLEEELEREKRLFDDFEKRFKKASQTYEGIINSLPATMAGSGAAIAAAAAVGLVREALAVGIAFGGLNYAWIEYCQRVKMSTIKGLEKETSTLEDKLEQLSGQAKSIDEVARIVEETLKGLNRLQEQIDHFMEFLISIQKMILVVRDDKEDVLLEDLTLEDRKELKCDAKLKRGILSDALLMKNRFLIVSKATGLYNEVSESFVIPGVRWVTGLRLVEPAEEVIADKLKEIELWKVKTCKEAEELIIKRVNELGIELEVLNRESMKLHRRSCTGDFGENDGRSRGTWRI